MQILFSLNNIDIGNTETFCYWGSISSKQGGAEYNIRQHINKARHAIPSMEYLTHIAENQTQII